MNIEKLAISLIYRRAVALLFARLPFASTRAASRTAFFSRLFYTATRRNLRQHLQYR